METMKLLTDIGLNKVFTLFKTKFNSLINDGSSSTTNTYSSYKIDEKISDAVEHISTKVDSLETNTVYKSQISDSGEASATTLWSSQKVSTELEAVKQLIASEIAKVKEEVKITSVDGKEV